jgi:hypothetical protein
MIATFMAITLFASCDDKEDDNGRIEIFIVGPKLVPNGTNPPSSTLVYVMEIKLENSNEMYYLSYIEGFEYTEGYEYRLKVLITPIKNPPQDIIYPETFKLIEILSVTEIE